MALLSTDRWPHVSLWRWETLAYAAAAGLIGLHIAALQGRIDRDSANILVVAHEIAGGAVPYRDIFDNKPPALHYWYALLIAITDSNGIVAAKLSLLMANLSTALFVFLAGKRLGGEATGLVAVVLLLYGMLAFEGTLPLTEPYMAMFLALGFWLLLRNLALGFSRRRSAMLGAVFALATLFKLPAAAAMLPVFAVLMWASASRETPSANRNGFSFLRREAIVPAATFIAGFLSVWTVTLLLLTGAGALPDFLSTIVGNLDARVRYRSFAQYVDRNRGQFLGFPLLWELAAMGLVMILASWRRDHSVRARTPQGEGWTPGAPWALTGLAAFMFIADTVPRAAHPHYWLGHLPFLALLAALGATGLLSLLAPRRWLLGPALVLSGYLAYPSWPGVTRFVDGLAENQRDALAQQAFAAQIRSYTRDDERIMMIAYQPIFYLLSERWPAYRYAMFTGGGTAAIAEANAGAIRLLESGAVRHVVIADDDISYLAEPTQRYVRETFHLIVEDKAVSAGLYEAP